jgi:hypothetical protein
VLTDPIVLDAVAQTNFALIEEDHPDLPLLKRAICVASIEGQTLPSVIVGLETQKY